MKEATFLEVKCYYGRQHCCYCEKSVTGSSAMTKYLRAPSPLLWHLSVSFKNIIGLCSVVNLIKCPLWLSMLQPSPLSSSQATLLIGCHPRVKLKKIHLVTGDAIRLCRVSCRICTGSFWASVDHVVHPVSMLAWKFECWYNANQQSMCWMRKMQPSFWPVFRTGQFFTAIRQGRGHWVNGDALLLVYHRVSLDL